MQIQIQVHGYLRHIVPKQFIRKEVNISLKHPITMYQLIRDLLLIKNLEAIAIVNGRVEGFQYVTKNGDKVVINSLIAGG